MFYKFLLFLLFSCSSFFDAIEKNVITESYFFDEFIIIDNADFLGRHFSSDLYLIEDGQAKYVVKQMQEDYHYEIEKDYIVTLLGNLFIQESNIQGVRFSNVFYIPAFIESPIKKYKNKAALVIEYHEESSFVSIKKQLQLKTDLPKKKYDESQKGLSKDILRAMNDDERCIFIIAFDTFFCNFDRHNENILYDPYYKDFILIDQGVCYNIPIIGLEVINSLQKNHLFQENALVLEKYFFILNLFIKKSHKKA